MQFLLIGAALFVLDRRVIEPKRTARPAIAISFAQVAELRRDALAETGRLPDRHELTARIDAAVADEILYREARRLGLAEEDPVVRRRLAQNMRFVRGHAASGDAALYREAVSLGMDESDPLVRRRLIQRMRLAIDDASRRDEPTDEELQAFLFEHPNRFAEPERVRISHVFFDRARRGEAADADASRLLATFKRNPTEPKQAAELGDPFLVPAHLPLQSERALAKLFGAEFARAVVMLPATTWSGPLRSSCGTHLVWVHEKVAGGTPPLDAVRKEVRHALLAERAERAVADVIARLRRRYDVQVCGGTSHAGLCFSWRRTEVCT